MKKIGVFICHCGTNISTTVNIQEVMNQLKTYPGVASVTDYKYMCSEPGQEIIKEAIKKHKLEDSFVDINKQALQNIKDVYPEGKLVVGEIGPSGEFQDPFGSLNPRMTVGQSIAEGLRTIQTGGRQQRRKRVAELLEMVGIPAWAAERYPHEFSGGQRQRIGIARALSVKPELMICDEPISALDVSIQAQILNLLRRLQGSLGLSYIFIAHDLNVVEYVSDTVAIMYLGHIMEYGQTEVVYGQHLHPYSTALLESAPVPEPSAKRSWTPLVGEVPSPFNPPPGCKFQNRCPLVEDRCRQGEITLYKVNDPHWVRCWKVLGR